MTEHFDVLIIGAGLSGIGAAYTCRSAARRRRYAILEARERIGGTWDLFRYPGIRSDSDLLHPWATRSSPGRAEGDRRRRRILEYITETARENGIERHIRFGHRVTAASWSTRGRALDRRGAASGRRRGEPVTLHLRFLFCCAGYYRYDRGYTPDSRASSASRGGSCIRRPGPRTSTTRASGSW